MSQHERAMERLKDKLKEFLLSTVHEVVPPVGEGLGGIRWWFIGQRGGKFEILVRHERGKQFGIAIFNVTEPGRKFTERALESQFESLDIAVRMNIARF